MPGRGAQLRDEHPHGGVRPGAGGELQDGDRPRPEVTWMAQMYKPLLHILLFMKACAKAEMLPSAKRGLCQPEDQPQEGDQLCFTEMLSISTLQVLKPVIKEWCYKPSDFKQTGKSKRYRQYLKNLNDI